MAWPTLVGVALLPQPLAGFRLRCATLEKIKQAPPSPAWHPTEGRCLGPLLPASQGSYDL